MSGQHFPADYRPSPMVAAYSYREIDAMRHAARLRGKREAIKVGVSLGIFLGLAVAFAVGISLDVWRTANDAQLRAAADARYAECMALWNETQPESYSSAISTRRQIVAVRGER